MKLCWLHLSTLQRKAVTLPEFKYVCDFWSDCPILIILGTVKTATFLKTIVSGSFFCPLGSLGLCRGWRGRWTVGTAHAAATWAGPQGVGSTGGVLPRGSRPRAAVMASGGLCPGSLQFPSRKGLVIRALDGDEWEFLGPETGFLQERWVFDSQTAPGHLHGGPCAGLGGA